jgi:hypothetical protein
MLQFRGTHFFRESALPAQQKKLLNETQREYGLKNTYSNPYTVIRTGQEGFDSAADQALLDVAGSAARVLSNCSPQLAQWQIALDDFYFNDPAGKPSYDQMDQRVHERERNYGPLADMRRKLDAATLNARLQQASLWEWVNNAIARDQEFNCD